MYIIKSLLSLIFLVISSSILQLRSQTANLILHDTTIANTSTFMAINSITAGPNFKVANTGEATLITGGFIYFRPRIVVLEGGQLCSISDPTLDLRTTENPILIKFSLEQNYPNPFNPSTTISFALPARSFVSLELFDALGRELTILLSEELNAGTYEQKWDATGLTSGIYFYRLQAGSFTETKKLILLR